MLYLNKLTNTPLCEQYMIDLYYQYLEKLYGAEYYAFSKYFEQVS